MSTSGSASAVVLKHEYNWRAPDGEPEVMLESVPSPPKRKKLRDLKPYDAKVLKFLKMNPGAHSLKTIASEVGYELTGTSRSAFVRRIDLMIAAGKIEKRKHGNAVAYAIGEGESVSTPAPKPAPELIPESKSDQPLFTLAYYEDHVRLSHADALKLTEGLAAG